MKFNLLLGISCLFLVGGSVYKIQSIYFTDETFSEALDCTNMDSYHMDLKIRKKLLCNYDKNIRPEEHVAVIFAYIFKSFSFDDEKNVMKIKSWITLNWNDDRLKWNPDEFEQVDKTFASFDLIWVPDITLMQS